MKKLVKYLKIRNHTIKFDREIAHKIVLLRFKKHLHLIDKDIQEIGFLTVDGSKILHKENYLSALTSAERNAIL